MYTKFDNAGFIVLVNCFFITFSSIRNIKKMKIDESQDSVILKRLVYISGKFRGSGKCNEISKNTSS